MRVRRCARPGHACVRLSTRITILSDHHRTVGMNQIMSLDGDGGSAVRKLYGNLLFGSRRGGGIVWQDLSHPSEKIVTFGGVIGGYGAEKTIVLGYVGFGQARSFEVA